MKRSIYNTKNSITPEPAWYWTHGLHDAKILQVHQYTVSYENKSRYPNRKCLELILDATGALYENQVKAIRFYNYCVVCGNTEIANHWWMCDSLSFDIGKFRLKITSTDNRNDFDLIIQFEDAEIER